MWWQCQGQACTLCILQRDTGGYRYEYYRGRAWCRGGKKYTCGSSPDCLPPPTCEEAEALPHRGNALGLRPTSVQIGGMGVGVGTKRSAVVVRR